MRYFQCMMICLVINGLVNNFTSPAFAQTTGMLDTTLRQQIYELDQKVRIIEKRWELEQENAAAKAKETPLLSAGKDGFSLKAADGSFQLKLRGYMQTDGRFMMADKEERYTNTFLLRRIRPIFEGTVQKYFDFYIMPDFGEGKTVLQDAYLDFHYWAQVRLRIGKFKEPFGLERLQSGANLLFVERALPNNLVPNRDVGMQLHGELLKGVLAYAAGVFNGVADGASADYDNGDEKDCAGRIFLQPFKNTDVDLLQGLGVGVAGSVGKQQGSTSFPNLPTSKTPAQQNFVSYRSEGAAAGTVVADGKRSRISPQGYYYQGSFGLFGEYVISSQEVKRAATSVSLKNEAWQLAGSFVLTGEKVSYKGLSAVKPFDPKAGQWGAIELAARVSELKVDPEAFPFFADLAKSPRKTRAWAVGMNCYLNKNVRFVLNYERTDFTGGAVEGDRRSEKAFLQRFQISF